MPVLAYLLIYLFAGITVILAVSLMNRSTPSFGVTVFMVLLWPLTVFNIVRYTLCKSKEELQAIIDEADDEQ
jgi:hypothetical protein